MNKKLEKYTPEGYDTEAEQAVMLVGTLIAIIYSLITFIINLNKLMNNMYITDHGVKTLAKDVEIENFSNIMSGSFFIFVIVAAIELMFILIHYKYYTKNGKIIYLARRLPDKNYLMKKCVVSPFVRAIVIIIVGIVCTIIYTLFYLKAGQKSLPHQSFGSIVVGFIKMIF